MSDFIPPFDFLLGDTHLNHVRIREFEPSRLTWGNTLDAHNDTIINAWNQRVQPGQKVLHLGDWAMGHRDHWPGLKARMNGDITLLLGNHDRKAEIMMTYGFHVLDTFTWQDPELGLVVARHDPAKFTSCEIDDADVLLHGHLHSGQHHPAVHGHRHLCLSIEVVPQPPYPVSYKEFVELAKAHWA